MEWTDQLEHQLQYLGNCARGYIWMYRRDVQRFSQINRWLKGIAVTLSVLAGSFGVLAASLRIDQTAIFAGISAVLAFGTSFCQGYLSNSSYDDLISDLKRQISKYSGLVNNIKRQLGLPRKERERALDYHRWISKNYDELTETTLEPTESAIQEYKAVSAASGLPFPDDTGKDGNISIYLKQGENEEEKDGHSLIEAISPQDLAVVGKPGGTLRGQTNLQEALKYTDQHMKYELARLERHSQD